MGLTRCYKTEVFLHLLLILNGIISHRFEVIADYCVNFGHGVSNPSWWRRPTYTVHHKKSLEACSGLPIRVSWTFSLGVRAEALRAKIDWIENMGFWRGWSVADKFTRIRGCLPRIIFARIDRPVNTLQFVADSIHTKKLCSRLSSREVQF